MIQSVTGIKTKLFLWNRATRIYLILILHDNVLEFYITLGLRSRVSELRLTLVLRNRVSELRLTLFSRVRLSEIHLEVNDLSEAAWGVRQGVKPLCKLKTILLSFLGWITHANVQVAYSTAWTKALATDLWNQAIGHKAEFSEFSLRWLTRGGRPPEREQSRL